jgi:hypothetical protein
MKNKAESAIPTTEALLAVLITPLLNMITAANRTTFVAFFSSLKKKH